MTPDFTKQDIDYLIVGAGIPGLCAASHLKASERGLSVSVVEFSGGPGGLYKSTFIEDLGMFVDFGMHVYYESGVEEFDGFIRSALPESEWITLEGNKKDLAGIYWRGLLRKQHPYPDFRNESSLRRCDLIVRIIFASVRAKFSNSNPQTARELSNFQFGKKIHETVIAPILEKIYISESQSLDKIALTTPELRRIAVLNERWTMALSFFKGLKARLAYPDQFTIPLKRSKVQSGWYPRKQGFGQQVILPLANKLKSEGVDLHFNTSVTSIEKFEDGFNIGLTELGQDERRIFAKRIVWCAPIFPLASLLKIEPLNAPNINKPSVTRRKLFASVLMSGNNNIDPIYYFYVYDAGFKTFRVTNYCAYSDDSQIPEGHFLLGIEFWLDDQGTEEHEIIIGIEKEIKSFGISENANIVKIWLLPMLVLPPEPARVSVDLISRIASQISKAHDSREFTLSGPFVRSNVFFLQDVLRDLKIELDETIRSRS